MSPLLPYKPEILNTEATRHMCLFKFKFKLIKLKTLGPLLHQTHFK